jgi:hypothetical protein
MKKIYIVLLVLGVLLLVAALTNPDEFKHLYAITEHAVTTFEETSGIKLFDDYDKARNFSAMAQIMGSITYSRDFFFFSTTVYFYEGETKTIGIGAFGYVYLFRKLDRENLRRYHKSTMDAIKFK